MPARKKKRRERISRKPKKLPKIVFYIVLLLLLLLPPLYISSSRNFWKDDRKVSVVIRGEDAGVNIVTFDPTLSEITNIYIPENTQVESAKGLGVWKMGSIWELGQEEGVGGELVARTVTKHFKLPVSAWADKPALGLTGESLNEALRAVTVPYKTNLSLADKIGILLFSLSVKNPKRVDINLSQTSYLRKQTLKDGTVGFIASGRPPARILAIFADEEISESDLRIKLVDKTGVPGLAEEIGDIVESLGGKIAVIEKRDRESGECLIRAKDREIGKRLSDFLPCSLENINPESFDVEIEMGEEFSKVY